MLTHTGIDKIIEMATFGIRGTVTSEMLDTLINCYTGRSLQVTHVRPMQIHDKRKIFLSVQ